MKAYHGTNKENFNKILKSKYFKKGTWFAYKKEDALEFGGVHIFECEFKDKGFKGEVSWQFWLRERISLKELNTKYTEK